MTNDQQINALMEQLSSQSDKIEMAYGVTTVGLVTAMAQAIGIILAKKSLPPDNVQRNDSIDRMNELRKTTELSYDLHLKRSPSW